MDARVGPLAWLLSHLRVRRIEAVATSVHPYLSVRIVNGRLRLDARSVNHSGGRLRDAWDEAFGAFTPERRALERVLLLGLGGGSALDLLRARGVRAPIDAVELDPEVVRLAREHFDVERHAPLSIHVADAIAWVGAARERYDLVLIDLFVEDEIPAAARTEAFVRALGARLAPHGLLLFNQLGHTVRYAADARRFEALVQRTLGHARLVACSTNLVLAH